jgi:hypothetical protein
LQNRPDQALNALQQAIDEGWRLLTWFFLEIDPNVDSLRGLPRFTELIAILKADLAEQAQRVRALKESGEIAPLAHNVSELHESGASGFAATSTTRN